MAEHCPCQGQTHFTHYHQRRDGKTKATVAKITSAGIHRPLNAQNKRKREIGRKRDDNNGNGWRGLDKRTKLRIMGVERGCFEMLPYCITGEKQACSLSFPTECVFTHVRTHTRAHTYVFAPTELLNGAWKE